MIKEQFTQKQFSNPELASVNLLRRARLEYGSVPDTTWQRIKDEETSLIAEGLKGHLNIPFDYQNIDGQLCAADGQGFMQIAKNGLEYTEQQFYKDARYQFALTRAIHEYHEAQLAEQLACGQIDAQTIITISPYPEEAANKYGEAFVQMLGAQPNRKLGMIRAIEKTETGIRMYTRGIEESDLKTWNFILLPEQSAQDTDELVGKPFFSNKSALGILDDLQDQYWQESGRLESAKKNTDVWQFLNDQTEFKNHFFKELDKLSQSGLSDGEMLKKLNILRYNFWSAIKLKFDAANAGEKYLEAKSTSEAFSSSGNTMQQNREVFSACGMSIVAVDQLSIKQMSNEIFGGILRCVTCPFCKKIVDAKWDKSPDTLECLNSKCGAKVDKKGQRIDKKQKQEKSFSELISEIFENLFLPEKPKARKQTKK